MTVAIGKDGSIIVNGTPSTPEMLTAVAAKTVAEKPETAAILQADKTVTLEVLTSVIDLIKTAGIKKVAFSIEKK